MIKFHKDIDIAIFISLVPGVGPKEICLPYRQAGKKMPYSFDMLRR
jgi:hypothetical protein